MGSGMQIDRLMGGMDIKMFNDTGRINYLLEDSWMNHEYVIFEELFDAQDHILEQLKDILSSGVYRGGNQIFPIKTKFIICNTNKSRADFAKNASLQALMERFPLELKVEWKDYNKITYKKLLDTVFGSADPLLVYILDKFAKKGNKISPRIAIKAQELISACGPSCLEFLADFQKEAALLKSCINTFKNVMELQKLGKLLSETEAAITDLNVADIDTQEDLDDAKALLTKYQVAVNSVNKIKVDEEDVHIKTGILKHAQKYQSDITKTLALLV